MLWQKILYKIIWVKFWFQLKSYRGKKGKKNKKKKYFPGYVLLKLDLNKKIYHKIKNIQKVSGFLGPEGKPIPNSENEVKKIMSQISRQKQIQLQELLLR